MHAQHDVPLAPRTTLGIGGPAKRLVTVENVGELAEALEAADAAGERVLVLGGGSNLVVGDAGWDGVVVCLGMREVTVRRHEDMAVVSAEAGASWDELVAQTVGEGLVGVECLSGIPGQVGATPMQNVGAYGQEVGDTLVLVRAYDREARQVVTFDRQACGLSYRASVFKGSARYVILEVRFRLAIGKQSVPIRYAELSRALGVAEGERAPLAEVRKTVIALRRGKGMVVDPADPESRSAGSFFVNPILDDAALAALKGREGAAGVPCFAGPAGATKVSAAWLIERAGFAKGYTKGRVGISTKHALALVNRGGATAAELMDLAREIQAGVRAAFGVELSPEPIVV
jgi:UDP-N-acetylmuramate dehydrogenase